ncbi:MAG: Segment polarity protein dishevelled DVL-3 [Marteilia pararefringens]
MQSCHSQIPQVHQPPMMDYPPMMPPTFTHPIMQPGIPKMYMQQQQKLYHPYGDYNSGYACANLCQSMNGVNDYADARQSTTSMPPQLTQNHNMRPYSGPYMGNTPSMCPPNLNNEMYFPDNPLPSSTVDSSTCYGANTDFFENASQSSKSTRGVLYESTQQNLGYVVKSRGKTSRRRDNADLSVMSQDISAVSSSTESVLKMDNNRRECPINCIDMIIDMTKVRDAQLKTVLIDNNFYITRMSGEFIKAGLKQLDCILRIDEFSFTEALNFQSCEEKIDEFLREKKIFEISIGRLTDPKSIEMLVKLYNQPPMDSISTAPPQDHESSFALPRTNNENNHNAQQFPTPNIKNPSVVANKVVTRCSSSSSKETDTGSAFSDNNPGNSSNGKESEFDFNEPFDDLNFNGGIGDIRHNITLDTSLIDIVRFMKHPESKFDLTTRSFCSMRFQNSFTGHQLLEWLLTYVKGLYDQKDAKAFAQRLMVAKLIYCPLQTKSNRGQHCVFNENSFYIFTTVLDFDRKSFARLDEIPEESSSTGVNNNPAACSNSSVASKSNKDDALSVHSAPPSNSKLNTFPSSKIQRNSTVRRSGKFSTIV